MDHIHDLVNNSPKTGDKTPMQRARGDCVNIDDMECFGALVHYWEAPERRATRSKTLADVATDVPGRRDIWVGRSTVISGGHRAVPIEYNKGQWTLGPTIHRSYVIQSSL